jgi:hypothetical protein
VVVYCSFSVVRMPCGLPFFATEIVAIACHMRFRCPLSSEIERPSYVSW